MTDATEGTEFEQWLTEELNDLSHHDGFTCDRHGDIARGKREARRAALREAAERYGLGYEHDPETCERCADLRETLQEIGHMTDDEIEESLEVHGV